MHDTQGGGPRRARRLPRLLPRQPDDHRVPRVTSARVLAAAFDVIVGLRLLLPDDIVGSPLNPNFRLVAAHFFGDVPLGLALLAYGAAMTAGLYTDRWTRMVGWATWLALLTWLLVAVDLALVNLSLLGPVVYLLVVALHAFAYAHLLEWREQNRRDEARSAASAP